MARRSISLWFGHRSIKTTSRRVLPRARSGCALGSCWAPAELPVVDLDVLDRGELLAQSAKSGCALALSPSLATAQPSHNSGFLEPQRLGVHGRLEVRERLAASC